MTPPPRHFINPLTFFLRKNPRTYVGKNHKTPVVEIALIAKINRISDNRSDGTTLLSNTGFCKEK